VLIFDHSLDASDEGQKKWLFAEPIEFLPYPWKPT
jgi:hypothetical protein